MLNEKIIFFGALFISSAAFAGQYVGFHWGTDYGFKTDISKPGQKVGFIVGGVYGHDIADQFRAEFEVAYREGHKRTIYKDKAVDQLISKSYESKHSWSYMLNVLYDVNQLAMYNLTPYIGAGMGYGHNTTELKIKYDSHVDEEKRRDTDFAWQVIGGVSYPISDMVKSRVQYTYHRGQQHTINHSASVQLVRSF